MFSSDDSGSGNIIPGTPSDSEDSQDEFDFDIGKISTPMVAKKNFKMHLKDFDLSVMEPSEAPNFNGTVIAAPSTSASTSVSALAATAKASLSKDKPTKSHMERNKTVDLVDFNAHRHQRRAPPIHYSSEDDSDSDTGRNQSQRQGQVQGQQSTRPKSIRAIPGTPSSQSNLGSKSDSASTSDTLSSFEFERDPQDASGSSPSSSGSKTKSKPSKAKNAAKSKSSAQARLPDVDEKSTILMDDLAEQVSQIGLNLKSRSSGGSSRSRSTDADAVDVALNDIGRQMKDVSIEEVSVRREAPEVIDIEDDSEIEAAVPRPKPAEPFRIPKKPQTGEVPRPTPAALASQSQTQQKQQQQQRQLIFLPEALPMGPQQSTQTIPSAYIGEEMRGSLGNMITSLQKIISSIPKEDTVDPLGKPSLLKVDLYTHQKYGLQWLWWREQHKPYGGILADEMGLGKTVMILALICRGKLEGTKENNPTDWRSVENKRLVPSRGTLVVCPASVMGQWEAEVTKKARGLKVLVYHGQSRPKSASVLAQYDVVITTYNTLGSEIPKLSEQTAEACRSPMVRVSWLRIVLDEGHVIRNAKTGGSQAACRLTAQHRWVVTGTPVHNKPADMFSLVKFLRLTPFDDVKVWESWIGMKQVLGQNAGRLHTIGKALLLRRTKDEVMAAQAAEGPSWDGAAIQSIPVKTVHNVFVDLKEEEKEIYEHLNTFATQEFRAFLKSKQLRTEEMQRAADQFIAGRPRPVRNIEEKSFTHIFTLILRLRQCSVLPNLIRTMIDEDEDQDVDASFDPIEDLISLKNPVFAEEFKSAKLEKMYEDLDCLKRECKARGEHMEKVVIVSQWTSLLKIVEQHLALKGYSLTTISGEVKIRDRTDIMGKFNADPKRPQIMLLSLAAGGVGLNLVGANHLYFLDIHWNPQLELQAQDRIHRFGQKKPVTIHRYISRGTIEEKVVSLQEKKLELADGILNNAQKKNGGGLSIPEMRQLFGM